MIFLYIHLIGFVLSVIFIKLTNKFVYKTSGLKLSLVDSLLFSLIPVLNFIGIVINIAVLIWTSGSTSSSIRGVYKKINDWFIA